jgi:hypothetical protein
MMRIEHQQHLPAPERLARRSVSPELTDRSSQFYTIHSDGTAITCHICGCSSTDPHDIEHKFCPKCFIFHEDRILMLRLSEGFETEFDPLSQDWSHFKSAA